MSDDARSTALTATERRAAGSLALIYMVRMFGLFIILPVFALYARDYSGATPTLIGLALGIYGLLQALLQIPFGWLSDRVGRKPVIAGGLLLLAAGSVIAATSDSIYGVIAGRALQGAGAIASALMALAADLTRDEQRTKIMAMLGASIGLSFVLALLLGPLLAGRWSIDALFWFTGGCALAGIAILFLLVPSPAVGGFHADTGASLPGMRRLLTHPQLLRLDLSIFLLHLLITASFVAIPLKLADGGLDADHHWRVYVPALVLSVAVLVPGIVLAERRAMRGVMLAAVAGMLVTQLLLGRWLHGAWQVGAGLVLFFSCLNLLESLLPSLVSRIAPAAAKGSAMGIYSSSQFIGSFLGGVGGGWLYGQGGVEGLTAALAGVCALWFLVLAGFRPPARLKSRRHVFSDAELRDIDTAIARLRAQPGVREVAWVESEQAAYLKVDGSFNEAADMRYTDTPRSMDASV